MCLLAKWVAYMKSRRGGGNPPHVGMTPTPTYEPWYMRWPSSQPPSISPIRSVLLVPSVMWCSAVRDRLVKTPSYADHYWLVPRPDRPAHPR